MAETYLNLIRMYYSSVDISYSWLHFLCCSITSAISEVIVCSWNIFVSLSSNPITYTQLHSQANTLWVLVFYWSVFMWVWAATLPVWENQANTLWVLVFYWSVFMWVWAATLPVWENCFPQFSLSDPLWALTWAPLVVRHVWKVS